MKKAFLFSLLFAVCIWWQEDGMLYIFCDGNIMEPCLCNQKLEVEPEVEE